MLRNMLFDLYEELDVTADEARRIADAIDNGKLDGNCWINPHRRDCGCLIGLVSIVKGNQRFGYHIPDEYEELSLSGKYEDLEKHIKDKNNHIEVAQWVREYAGQC